MFPKLNIILVTLLVAVTLPKKIRAQSTVSKCVKSFSMDAPELKTKKKIWLYVPKSYSNSKKSYEVLYMHDAQNVFDSETSYAGEWQVDEFLDSLTNPETIVVAIEHGNEKRIDELTPFKNETYGGGKGDNYVKFIRNTLKPYIDTNYRTKKEPNHTTILGSSLGGLISFYAAITYPETFGKAGVFSPAFWINPEIDSVIKTAKYIEDSKFYFMAGTAESDTMIENMDRIISLLKQQGVPNKNIKHIKVKDGKHNEQLWSAQFAEAYNWLIPRYYD